MENKSLISYDLRDYSEEIQSLCGISSLIENVDILDTVKVLTTLCPKLILAGSISLHALGVVSLDFKNREPDLDFSLSEPLTEDELLQIISLLELSIEDNYFESKVVLDSEVEKVTSEPPKKDNISALLKKSLIRLKTKSGLNIDIFNSNYNNDYKTMSYEPLYPLDFGGFIAVNNNPNTKAVYKPHIVYAQHPSVTISYKTKYAFYSGYSKSTKHKNDCVDFFSKNYSYIMDRIKLLDNKKAIFVKAIEIFEKENSAENLIKLLLRLNFKYSK